MSDRIYHREDCAALESFCFRALRLAALCTSFLFVFTLATLSTATTAVHQTRQPLAQKERTHYRIQLTLDYENRAYNGTEHVRWTNRGDHPTSTLYFHL